jgi:hypothetical protein
VANGEWKITLHVNNTDVPEQVGGVQSTWFLSEKSGPLGDRVRQTDKVPEG